MDHLRQPGVELNFASLDDAQALTGAVADVDVVYHLAGLTRALDPQEMFRVNRDGAAHLAAACARQPQPPKLVLVSSVAAAGPIAAGQVRSEADPPAPVSIYGRSKLAGEEAAKAFADHVPLTIVRPGIVFGPQNRAMLPIFKAIKYFNFHLVPSYRSPPLSYIYVDDLVEMLVRAAEQGSTIPASGQPGAAGQGYYFAVDSEHPTYADLGRMAGNLLHRPLAIIFHCLGPAPWIIAGANEWICRLRGKPDELNLDKMREATVSSWACSAERANRELAFRPPVSLAERLRQTIDWYRQAHWL